MKPEPQVLGRFELRVRIGEGAMGVVYHAWDRERGENVAIKRLRSIRPEGILRFKREFRTLQDLVHPNLVRLHELYEEDGEWFFSMERIVDGVPFSEYVRPTTQLDPHSSQVDTLLTQTQTQTEPTRSPPPPAASQSTTSTLEVGVPQSTDFDGSRLRAALGQLVAGLSALHRAGKVHRDIKPSNVLVTPTGRVVILDFGLVAETDMLRSGPLERSAVGTALFMAPEQAANGPVGPEADWYSVGVMLYHALTGRLPLVGSPGELLRLKQQVEPLSPQQLCPQVSATLSTLCQQLLLIDPAQRASGRDILAALGLEQPTGPQGAGLGPREELVGRETELSFLYELLHRANESGPLAVLVTGVSGVGKSALVRTFSDLLFDEARVFSGRCYERESVPFKALDELMEKLAWHLGTLSTATVDALLPRRLAALLHLFPVLRRLPAVKSRLLSEPELGNLDPHVLRSQALVGLRELIFGLCQKGPPVVLVIDDLQWSDADSLLLLQEVLRPPSAPKLLLLCTVRTSGEPDKEGVQSTLPSELLSAFPVPLDELALHNLPAESAQALCERLLAQAAITLPAEEISTLVSECMGHPMLLEALLRHRLEQPQREQPVRLDQALWSRCQQLPAEALELLSLVALSGGPIRQDQAARAAGCELSTVAQLSRVLAAQNLLRTRGSGPTDPIEPFHDRVRETVVAHLTAPQRQRLHAMLAKMLEAALQAEGETSPGNDYEMLARHLEGGGEPDRAAAYAETAALRAAAALAFHRAARLLRWTLALTEQTDSPADKRQRGRRLVLLGDILTNAGRGREAAEALLAASPLMPEAQSRDLQRRAAEQLLVSGHIQRGVMVLEQVTARVGIRVPETPQRALATLLYNRGRLWLRGLDFISTPAEQLNPELLSRLDSCWTASVGLAMVENLRAASLQTQTLLLALTAGEPYRIARSLGLEACFVSTLGYAAEAQAAALCARAQSLAEQVGHPHALGLAAAGAAVNAFLLGRWRRGYEKSMESLRILRERATAVTWEIDSMQLFETWCMWMLGEVLPLRRQLFAYLREAEERGNLYAHTTLRLLHGSSTWLASDEPETADREVAEALRLWAKEDGQLKKYGGYKLQHHYAFYAQAENDLYSRRGLAGYYRLLEQWPGLARAQLLRIQHTRISMTAVRARCALQGTELTRSTTERAELLRAAERDARSLLAEKAPWAAALAQLTLAAVRFRAGAVESAARMLGTVATEYARLEMPLHAAAACRRKGELEGGYTGQALVAHADESLRNRGILRPDQMAHSLAPGFAARVG